MVEVVPPRRRVAQVVGEDHVHGHLDPVLLGLDLVRGIGDDRQVGGRGPDLGCPGGRRQEPGRRDQGEDERQETPAQADGRLRPHSSSSGRRGA